METEVPSYIQNYQDERFSQQPRQLTTRSYEGRSLKTYVSYQETNSPNKAYYRRSMSHL